jgi:hypothetical protein
MGDLLVSSLHVVVVFEEYRVQERMCEHRCRWPKTVWIDDRLLVVEDGTWRSGRSHSARGSTGFGAAGVVRR